jgi:hypothetical protein
VQTCCPELEKVPVGQGPHTALGPISSISIFIFFFFFFWWFDILQRKEPAGQFMQEVAPEARSVPTGQGVHTPDPIIKLVSNTNFEIEIRFEGRTSTANGAHGAVCAWASSSTGKLQQA